MIQPIFTANQAIANRTVMPVSSISFGRAAKLKENEEPTPVQAPPVDTASITTNSAEKGEKLDINFEGCREYSLNGNKINYFA